MGGAVQVLYLLCNFSPAPNGQKKKKMSSILFTYCTERRTSVIAKLAGLQNFRSEAASLEVGRGQGHIWGGEGERASAR